MTDVREAALDLALAKGKNRNNWLDRREVMKLRPRARRYMFSEDASHRLGEIIRNCGGSLMENRQFAIPPHPVTYVEVYIKVLNEGIGKGVSTDLYKEIEEDNRVGFLITANPAGDDIESIRVFVSNRNDEWVSTSLFRYEHTGLDELYLRMDPLEYPNEEIRASMLAVQKLGTTFHDMKDPYALNHEWKTKLVYSKIKKYVSAYSIRGTNGELRVALAALLVLNQPDSVKLIGKPAKRGDAASRNRPYAAHSVVEVALGKKKEYVKFFGPATIRASSRRHEVEGHFVHHNCEKGCEHEWPLVPEPSPFSGAPRWTCFKCGGTRTWRKAFERGDASLGYVTKRYDVNYP